MTSKRALNRRRILQALTATGMAAGAAEAQETSISLDSLRAGAALTGRPLAEERLRTLQPVLERRQARLQPLRDLEIDDAIPSYAPIARG